MPRSRSPVTKKVASTSSASPTEVLSLPVASDPDTYVAQRALDLTGITATNTQAPGIPAQVHVGILRRGASAWDGQILSPHLDGGEFIRWSGRIRLREGDAVQSYSDVADRIHVTLETTDSEA